MATDRIPGFANRLRRGELQLVRPPRLERGT